MTLQKRQIKKLQSGFHTDTMLPLISYYDSLMRN